MEEQNAAREESLDCACPELRGILEFAFEESNRARPPMPSHAHAEGYEISLFRKGIQSMEVSGEEYAVMGGDIVIIPPKATHSTAMQPRYRTSLYRIRIDARAKARLMGMEKKRGDEVIASLSRLRSIVYHGSPETQALVEGAFCCLSSPDGARRRRGAGMLLCFLMSLEDALSDPSGGWRDKTVKAAVEYINDNIEQRLELSDVAERVGASLSYFKAQFRRQTGVSPMYYINWRKIAYAKRLIAQGYSVTDTAMRLSFNSSAYFSTVFRNITSRTPLQYRRFIDEEMAKQQHLWTLLRVADED